MSTHSKTNEVAVKNHIRLSFVSFVIRSGKKVGLRFIEKLLPKQNGQHGLFVGT